MARQLLSCKSRHLLHLHRWVTQLPQHLLALALTARGCLGIVVYSVFSVLQWQTPRTQRKICCSIALPSFHFSFRTASFYHGAGGWADETFGRGCSRLCSRMGLISRMFRGWNLPLSLSLKQRPTLPLCSALFKAVGLSGRSHWDFASLTEGACHWKGSFHL